MRGCLVELVILSPAAVSIQAWPVRVQTAAHCVVLLLAGGWDEPHGLWVVAGLSMKGPLSQLIHPHLRGPLLGIDQRMFRQFGGVVHEGLLHSPLDQFSGGTAEQALLEAQLGLGPSLLWDGRETIRREPRDRRRRKVVFAPRGLRGSDAYALTSVDSAGGEDGGDDRSQALSCSGRHHRLGAGVRHTDPPVRLTPELIGFAFSLCLSLWPHKCFALLVRKCILSSAPF